MTHGFSSQRAPIIEGLGTPNITPSYIGQEYYDLSTGSIYKAMGTNGKWNWAFVGRGSLSEFNKNTISGLVGWHDFSDVSTMTLDGTNILSITDKSDSNITLLRESTHINTYTEDVQNGLSACLCGTSSVYGATTTSYGTSFTRAVVIKPTGWGTGGYQAIVGHNSIGVIGKYTGNTNLHLYNGASAAVTALTNTTPYIVIGVFNATSSFCYVNGVKYTIPTPGTSTLTRLNAGADYLVGEYFTGYLFETLTYDSVLTEDECEILNVYLNNKWGIY